MIEKLCLPKRSFMPGCQLVLDAGEKRAWAARDREGSPRSHTEGVGKSRGNSRGHEISQISMLEKGDDR